MKPREKLKGVVRSAGRPASALGAAGVGVAGASLLAALGTSESNAHPTETDFHLGRYTYSSSDCTDVGVDPITIIFTGDELTSQFIRMHANRFDHGWWWFHVGSPQYFWDHFDCEPFDDQSATGGGGEDRFHVRYNLADSGGVAEYVPPYGYHAPASPHDEEIVWPGCGFFGPPKHAVRANDEVPGGGFVSARQKLLDDWTNAPDGEHFEVGALWWDNREWHEQCDGGLVRSDGYVYILDTMSASGGSGNPKGRGFSF